MLDRVLEAAHPSYVSDGGEVLDEQGSAMVESLV